MRITPQQIQIQLADIKANPKLAVVLKVGEVFEGKVLNVLPDAIVLQLNSGETLRAEVSQLERFVEGDTLEFQVKESSQEAVKVEIVTPSKIQLPAEVVKQQLSSVELKATDANVKAYEVLKSLDMNITKSNIETLSQNFKFLSTVHDKLEQVLPQVIQTDETVADPKAATLPRGETLPKGALLELSQALGFESETALKEADLKEVVVRLLNTVPENKEMPSKMPVETLKEVFGLVRETLTNQLDMEDTMVKAGKLLKMSKPLTIKSFSILDKLTFEGQKLGDQVKEVIQSLDPKVSSPKLLSLLKGFEIKGFKNETEVKVFFDSLMSELEVAKQSSSTRGKALVEQLMTSISFLEKEQDEVSWIQLPIQMNQTTETLDLFFKHDKKESKNLSKDNAKILIALNTEHLDVVQALVQVKGQTLDIKFSVQSEPIKALFETNLDLLKNRFEDDFASVSMHVQNKKPMTYSEFVFDETSGHINLIV